MLLDVLLAALPGYDYHQADLGILIPGRGIN